MVWLLLGLYVLRVGVVSADPPCNVAAAARARSGFCPPVVSYLYPWCIFSGSIPLVISTALAVVTCLQHIVCNVLVTCCPSEECVEVICVLELGVVSLHLDRCGGSRGMVRYTYLVIESIFYAKNRNTYQFTMLHYNVSTILSLFRLTVSHSSRIGQ